MSHPKVVLDEDDIRRTLVRIAHEIVEKNPDGQVALVGIHRRGAHLATRLHRLVSDLLETELAAGEIDIAFYRDDLATREAPEVRSSHLPFRLDEHTIVLVDDVLYTGRTVRAAIEALFDYGRPARVQLAVLADRGLSAAVQALGARAPMPVDVEVPADQRPPPVVETAAYFVVAEALTNVAKHAGGAPARVVVGRGAGHLVVEIHDTGPGGADPRGGGLTGLRHRVEAIDGALSVTSPAGGPTTIRAELPCAS